MTTCRQFGCVDLAAPEVEHCWRHLTEDERGIVDSLPGRAAYPDPEPMPDRPPKACAVDGCERPRAGGDVTCKGHSDLAAKADTAEAREISQNAERERYDRIAAEHGHRMAKKVMKHLDNLPTGAGGQSALVCPHCHTAGSVSSRRIRQKKGVSGGKATGAVLTAGWSLLATGLSRKEGATEMRCGHCGTKWVV